jgi:hypothetical protein
VYIFLFFRVTNITKKEIDNLEDLLGKAGISLPVYVKPSSARTQPEGMHSGKKINSWNELVDSLKTLENDVCAIVEEFIPGNEYRVLVAGDARDPNAEVVVFPPVQDLQHGFLKNRSDFQGVFRVFLMFDGM